MLKPLWLQYRVISFWKMYPQTCPCFFCHLRVYPVPFARAVCDLLEPMKSTCKGQPCIEGPIPTAIETMSMEWFRDDELWQFVDFQETYRYLRGSKRLAIPDEWRPIIPDKL